MVNVSTGNHKNDNNDSQAGRRATRLSVHVPIRLRIQNGDTEKLYTAEILNVSEGGAFIHGVLPIDLGQQVVIEIDLSQVLEKVQNTQKVMTEVRWVRGSAESGFGVQFLGKAREKKQFLSALIEQIVQDKPVAA